MTYESEVHLVGPKVIHATPTLQPVLQKRPYLLILSQVFPTTSSRTSVICQHIVSSLLLFQSLTTHLGGRKSQNNTVNSKTPRVQSVHLFVLTQLSSSLFEVPSHLCRPDSFYFSPSWKSSSSCLRRPVTRPRSRLQKGLLVLNDYVRKVTRVIPEDLLSSPLTPLWDKVKNEVLT